MKSKKNMPTIPSRVRETVREMGSLIACARKEKGWSQEELAGRIGVSRMTVVRIEKGAPEVATGWYLTAAWLLGLCLFTWESPTQRQSDTAVGDLLLKLKRNLPQRVTKSRKKVDNDF